MQKMMTYSEANSVLESSLTPANRCLSKAVAIANDANPDLLVNFDNARLVPANVIELNTHWMDEHTIQHYFVDENGNRYGYEDNPNVTFAVPLHARYFPIRTKTTIDNLPPTAEFKGSNNVDQNLSEDRSKWTRSQGEYADERRWDIIYTQDPNYINHVPYNSGVILSSGYVNLGIYHDAKTDENGVSLYLLYLRDENYETQEGTEFFSLNFPSDTVNGYKISNIDQWNIYVTVYKDDVGYDVSKGIVELYNKEIGYSEDIEVTGFSGTPIVEFFPCGPFTEQYTSASVNGNTITITKQQEPSSSGYGVNIYKIYDSNVRRNCIYIGARSYNSHH